MLFTLRRPSHATVVAYLALFVALGGTSYAAIKVTSKNVPKDALTGADIKNLTGRDVRNNSIKGADVKNLKSADISNGALLAKDFAPGQLPKGEKGEQGKKGDQGVPGPFPDPLPSGKTVRGTYAAVDTESAAQQLIAADSIDFGFTLATAPTPHFLPQGAPSTSACPGTAAAPEATPGNLCVYEGQLAGSGTRTVVDPISSSAGSTRQGAVLVMNTPSTAGETTALSYGTWAVTAE